MALKMKIAAVLAVLTVTSAASVIAYADTGNFSLTARVEQSDIIPKADAVKKTDNLFAVVTPSSGVPDGFYVTFRVREYDGGYASDVGYARKNNVTYRMDYLDGHGEEGKTYRIAASLDPNPVVESTVVSGRWTP